MKAGAVAVDRVPHLLLSGFAQSLPASPLALTDPARRLGCVLHLRGVRSSGAFLSCNRHGITGIDLVEDQFLGVVCADRWAHFERHVTAEAADHLIEIVRGWFLVSYDDGGGQDTGSCA
jgi:hypothetical protein